MRSPAFRASREKFGVDRYSPDLALFAPLWYEGLQGSPFKSLDINRHVSTVTGALWTPQGRSLDGTDDVINCGDSVALDLTSAVTLWAWVKSTVTLNINQHIIGRDTGSAGGRNYYIWFADDATVIFNIWIGAASKTAKPGVVAVKDQWAFWGGTYDGANLYGYKNLTRGTATAASGAIDNGDVSFTAGLRAVASDRDFTGIIGEFGVYNRALTQAERASLYLSTKWRYGL